MISFERGNEPSHGNGYVAGRDELWGYRLADGGAAGTVPHLANCIYRNYVDQETCVLEANCRCCKSQHQKTQARASQHQENSLDLSIYEYTLKHPVHGSCLSLAGVLYVGQPAVTIKLHTAAVLVN